MRATNEKVTKLPRVNGKIRAYTPEERAAAFWLRVAKTDGCWIWNGAVTSHGYGCVQVGGRKVIGAHKYAYLISKGPVADGLQVMHSCDTPRCVNPAHLSLGTKEDNAQDMSRKGRGRKDGGYKLTLEQVREIKAARGKESSGVLAKRFGVVQSYIFGIWAGRTWRNA
jgi:hypothetical protein